MTALMLLMSSVAFDGKVVDKNDVVLAGSGGIVIINPTKKKDQ